MSHIHIPDGLLSWPIWVGSYIVMLILLFFALRHIKKEQMGRKIPYIGMMTAVMLVAMSIPLGIVPLHISLAVFFGILLGPILGYVSVFVANVILAFMGHGGITVIGLNTLVMALEVSLGYFLFQLFSFKEKFSPFWRGLMATVFTLLLTTSLTTGLLAYTVGWEFAVPHSHEHADHNYDESIDHDHDEDINHNHDEIDHDDQALEELNYLFLSGGMALVVILALGILIESLITGGLVAFLMDLRPHLFESQRKE
ncbi:MAG: hypothetical protein GX962_10090 [Epulopiscium sp.]|nr:hypothetical protein [Candidatus Epulonipiscium sp.]